MSVYLYHGPKGSQANGAVKTGAGRTPTSPVRRTNPQLVEPATGAMAGQMPMTRNVQQVLDLMRQVEKKNSENRAIVHNQKHKTAEIIAELRKSRQAAVPKTTPALRPPPSSSSSPSKGKRPTSEPPKRSAPPERTGWSKTVTTTSSAAPTHQSKPAASTSKPTIHVTPPQMSKSGATTTTSTAPKPAPFNPASRYRSASQSDSNLKDKIQDHKAARELHLQKALSASQEALMEAPGMPTTPPATTKQANRLVQVFLAICRKPWTDAQEALNQAAATSMTAVEHCNSLRDFKFQLICFIFMLAEELTNDWKYRELLDSGKRRQSESSILSGIYSPRIVKDDLRKKLHEDIKKRAAGKMRILFQTAIGISPKDYERILAEFDQSSAVLELISQVCDLAADMSVERPPLKFSTKKQFTGVPLDEESLEAFGEGTKMSSQAVVRYFVHPILMQDGRVLAKGRVHLS